MKLKCIGLEWTDKRGIKAREFTLKLSHGDDYSDKSDHLLGLIIGRKEKVRG